MKNVNETAKSSFQLKDIYLKKSVFEISNPELSLNGFDIEIRIDTIQQPELECALTVILSVKNVDSFKLSVTMVGRFVANGNLDFDVNDFLNINAPSIIYPYVRQYIRAVSLEAGMNAIILPVLNFVELHKNNTNTSDND